MGEIADMMVEGDLCQGCGVCILNLGFGRYCADCDLEAYPSAKTTQKIPCNVCGKYVKPKGLAMHKRDKHDTN